LCHDADHIALDRHIAPTKEPSTLLADNSGKERFALSARIGVGREKDHPDAILSGIGQRHTHIAGCALEKLVWDLQQNAGAVSRTGITALGPSMTQAFKDLKPLLNDRMGLLTLDVDDKTDPTGVFLLCRVVEALLRWKPGDTHGRYLVINIDVSATRRRLYQEAVGVDNPVTHKANSAHFCFVTLIEA
jgi:hypothetical protein